MTTDSATAGGDPYELLSGARRLTRQVRRAQRATWFPLLVFAAVTFGSIPVDRYGPYARTCRTGSGAHVCTVSSTAGFVYWPLALVAAYVAIAAFYVHRSRALGVGTRIRPYVVAGVVVAIVATGASFWLAHHPPVGRRQFVGVFRLASPACAIGVALLVLAWAERSRALLAVVLGYLVVVLAPIGVRRHALPPSRWAFLPHRLAAGAVLLLAAIGFALAQRRSAE